MASIEVDVTMEDFDDHEVIEELIYRIEHKHIPSGSILQVLNAIKDNYNLYATYILPVNTLEDIFKAEHILTVFDKYSANTLEKRIP